MVTDTPDLRDHLEIVGLSFRAMETSPSIVYILQGDSKIVFCNESWDRFALQNGGSQLDHQSVLGTSVLDITPDILRPFYANLFAKTRISGKISEHEIDLSSPEMFRHYRMRVLSIGGPYLCIENTRCIERPHVRDRGTSVMTALSCYEDKSGYITMCCNCRCTQRVRGTIKPGWDFVREFLAAPPVQARHNLCPKCWSKHYSEEQR